MSSGGGGLSRRRVGPSASQDPDDNWSHSNGHSATPSTSSLNASPSTSHAGSAFQGGSKIAFDPRDLEREDEDSRQGGKAPRLTIMEEVLLLGLKDKQVCFSFCTSFPCCVRTVEQGRGNSLHFSTFRQFVQGFRVSEFPRFHQTRSCIRSLTALTFTSLHIFCDYRHQRQLYFTSISFAISPVARS